MHWFSASLANMQIRWSMGRCRAPSNKIGPKTVAPWTDCSHKPQHMADTSSKGMHTYEAQPGYTYACKNQQIGTPSQ